MSSNSTHLEGNVGKAPAIKVNKNGKEFAIFSLAVNKLIGKNPDGTYIRRADWFTIKAWGKNIQAVMTHIQKGTAVAIDGILESWVDAKTSQTRTSIVMTRFALLARPAKKEAAAEEQPPKKGKKAA
jgi:single stranded DNA-binding protein